MTLDELLPGESATVVNVVHHDTAVAQHIMALGIFPDEPITCLRRAPLGDPLQVRAGHTLISVRREDAKCIHLHAGNPQL